MGKIEKKRAKLIERINQLETELKESLTKKTSDKREINVSDQMKKIDELTKELAKLK